MIADFGLFKYAQIVLDTLMDSAEKFVKRDDLWFDLLLIVIFSPFEEACVHVSQPASDNISHSLIFFVFSYLSIPFEDFLNLFQAIKFKLC